MNNVECSKFGIGIQDHVLFLLKSYVPYYKDFNILLLIINIYNYMICRNSESLNLTRNIYHPHGNWHVYKDHNDPIITHLTPQGLMTDVHNVEQVNPGQGDIQNAMSVYFENLIYLWIKE